jgi:hypothetical protein
MATIKLIGLNAGMTSTSGTGDVLETPGGLTIGDADTDAIEVNAEFISDLIPDVTNTVDLGNGEKAWRELCLGTALNLHGSGDYGVRLEWEDPTVQNETITIPARTGELALEGFLPSYIAFGKNALKTAPTTNFELCTVNGSSNAKGWRMPVAGLVTHISCQFDSTETGGVNTFSLSLWKNGVDQGANYQILLNNVPSGTAGASQEFQTSLPFAVNDTLTLKLSMTKGGGVGALFSMDDLACLLRILN